MTLNNPISTSPTAYIFLRRQPRLKRHCSAISSATKEIDTLNIVLEALKQRYGEERCYRVMDSIRFSAKDQEYIKLHPGKGMQKASSYIAGLTAEPFHDVGALHFAWLRYLEQNYSVIREELTNATLNPKLTALGNHIWVPAAREEAIAYGPDWKTLVLQDRCNWEETNCKIFPKTVQLVKNSGVPSVELFFAKQEPGTGIKPHTDNTNFILTSHLGLDVPEGQCWMQVGELKKNWLNGRGIIADTSFIHSTANESENRTRFVLIIRFWHPELLSNEKHALQFLFDALEDPTPDGLENTIRRADVRENLELEGKNPSCANKLRAKGKGLGLLSKGMK